MSMDNIVNLESVDRYNSMYGLETLHPLVSVVDLTKATKIINHTQMNYGVYALFLKQTKSCDLKYGRRSYDYQEGTIVSFAPGQVIGIELKENVQPSSIGIVFHPDLIRGTSLGQHINKYSFFSYEVSEALHVSLAEQQIITDCLKNITMELERAIDKHSKILIAKNIELLLSLIHI